MQGKSKLSGLKLVCFISVLLIASITWAADPIVIGVPTSTGFLEGKEGLKAVELAVEEINAAGGVDVGRREAPLRSNRSTSATPPPASRSPKRFWGWKKSSSRKNRPPWWSARSAPRR